MQHIAHNLSRTWRAFRWDRRGNVAMIFALAAFPLLGFVGVAIDYSRANAAKVKLQAAMDSAGLMLAKEPTLASMSPDARNAKAKKYFDAQFKVKDAKYELETVSVDYNEAQRKMDIRATITIPNTPFYNALNKWVKKLEGSPDPTYQGMMTVGATSTVKWGARLRVAFALDTTGSMDSDDKITALKTAVAGAGGAIDQLKKMNKTDGDVYISIVPFAVHVNAGAANYTHNEWIDWTQWEAPPSNASTPSSSIGPGSTCPFTTGSQGFNCTTGPANGSPKSVSPTDSSRNMIPTSGTYKGYICPSADNGSANESRGYRYYNGCWTTGNIQWDCTGSSCSCGSRSNCSCFNGTGSDRYCAQGPFTHTWVANDHSTWKGCLMDRNDAAGNPPTTSTSSGPDQTADSSNPPSPKYPADQYSLVWTGNVLCSPNNVMRSMANDWGTTDPMATGPMHDFINGLKTGGATNQPIGLAWAWQSLKGGGPLTVPAKTA